MTNPSDASADDDPIVGDPDGINVRNDDEFDYMLSRADGEGIAFDAVEIAEIRELLEHMQGDG